MKQSASAVGMAVAATAGLYLAALAGPPVSAILLPLVPLPGLVLGGRHGARALGACVALSTLVMAGLLGDEPALTYGLAVGAPTLAASAALRRGWSLERTVLLGAAVWSGAVALLLFGAYGTPTALLAGVRGRLQESFDLAVAASNHLGMASDAVADLAAARAPIIQAIVEILPGVLVLAGAFTMLVNVLIVRRLLPSLQRADLRAWSAPPLLIWAFIAAGFGMFVPVPAIDIAARNIFILLLGCYFCQGLAIVSFYLDWFRMRRGLRVAMYGLVLTQQVLMLVVVMLGVFDLWANFRRVGVVSSAGTDP